MSDRVLAVVLALALRALWSRLALGSALPGIAGAGLATLPWLVLPPAPYPWWAQGLGLTLLAAGVPAAVEARAAARAGWRTPSWSWPAVWLAMAAGATVVLPADAGMPWSTAAAIAALLWLLSGGVARALVPVREPPVSGWTALNTLAGYAAFSSFCAQLPLLLPVLAAAGRGRRRALAWLIRIAMRGTFLATPAVRWRLDGAVDALDRPGIVAANHEGMLDILAIGAFPGRPRTPLAKGWVFRHPVLGIAAWAGDVVNVDRLDREDYAAPERISPAAADLSIFPEGRRSRDGALDRFRPGAAVLARALGRPLIPVAQVGTRLGIRPGSLWIRPSRCLSIVLPPLAPDPAMSNRQVMAEVGARIAAARHAGLRAVLADRLHRLARAEAAIGLPWAERRRLAAAEADLVPAILAAAAAVPADERAPWRILGAASAAAALLRQLAPAAPALADPADGAARHLGARAADAQAEPGILGGLIIAAAADPAAWAARLRPWSAVVARADLAPGWAVALGRRGGPPHGAWVPLLAPDAAAAPA